MDVLSTPRRPHKSPAHTVKDRILAQRFRFRVPNISSERAAYYTTIFVSVNTFLKTFSKKCCRYFALRSRQRRHQSKGGANHTSDFRFVNTCEATFLLRFVDVPKDRPLPRCTVSDRTTKGGESYIQFPIRQPQCATLFSEPRRARRCLSGDQAHTGERTLADLQQMLSTAS